MSDGFFPTDVRVRVEGDASAARALFGETRRVLFAALQLQQLKTGNGPVVLMRQLADNASVRVVLFGEIKVVTIFVGPPPPADLVPEVIAAVPEIHPDFVITMLNGWIRNGDIVGSPPAVDSFKPTPSNARAYQLPVDFALNRKLAVTSFTHPSVLGPASTYSGAMKRVVQAIYGIGIISDGTRSYITNEVPHPQRRPILCSYESIFDRTHGIYRAGPKNHWLIEVGVRGVLAMPLLVFPSTATLGYRARIAGRGDTDTLRILDEFGGIPTGESFPQETDVLDGAIAAGKILRLALSSSFAEFYRGWPYSSALGWAFSPDGVEAHNTCARIMSSLGEDRDTEQSDVTCNRSRLFGDHWKVAIGLSTHDIAGARAGTRVVGSGNATVQLVHRGMMFMSALKRFYFPRGSGLYQAEIVEALFPRRYAPDYGLSYVIGQPIGYSGYRGYNEFAYREGEGPFGATIHVYFGEDNRLVRVRWVPPDMTRTTVTAPVHDAPNDGIGFTIEEVNKNFSGAFQYLLTTDPTGSQEALCSNNFDPRFDLGVPGSGTFQYSCVPIGCREGWITSVRGLRVSYMRGWFGQMPERHITFGAQADMNTIIRAQQNITEATILSEHIPDGRLEANINAGPTRQYMINDGDFGDVTWTYKSATRCLRYELPRGLEEVKPLAMSWIGSV